MMKYATILNSGDSSQDHREVRQAGPDYQPIRIKPIFSSTVEDLNPDLKEQIKVEAVGKVIERFSKVLTVRPAQGNILLQRDCNGGSDAFYNPPGYCLRSKGCKATTCSSLVNVTEDHLAACKVCDDDGTNCSKIGQDGAGVSDADFVLYVSANTTFAKCSPTSATLAFATVCQLERQQDRPVAGFTNICVNRALNDGIENLRSILFHELTHALVFGTGLFAFYRDENGNPRTARDPNTGLPKNLVKHQYVPDNTTVSTTQLSRTTIPNGTFTYTVSEIVTPAVIREVRSHFGCDTLTGALLEDFARAGTAGAHFKERVFMNEMMVGTTGPSNAILSNITLALYEDSGWYKPNYAQADLLRWGKNEGCDFVTAGCLDPKTKTLHHLFCEDQLEYIGYISAVHYNRGYEFRQFFNSTCTYDRTSVGTCINYNNTTPFDPNFQYFTNPYAGGSDGLTDYCPYVNGFISCKYPIPKPLPVNAFGETFGPNSKCVDFKIEGEWEYLNKTTHPVQGGACYEVFCDKDEGPLIALNGGNYSCLNQKEILVPNVDLPEVANIVTVICPPCEELCWDHPEICSSVPKSTTTHPVMPTTSKTAPTTTNGPTSTSQPTVPSFFGASITSVALFGGGLLALVVAILLIIVVTIVACVVSRKRRKARKVQYSRLPIQDLDGDYHDNDDLILDAD
jgi:leishmanolysin-like peptidase